MPTVPLYVSANVSRQLAAAWKIDSHDNDLLEIVRSLCTNALEDAAGIGHSVSRFSPDCVWSRLHRVGYRCRHCGGSS